MKNGCLPLNSFMIIQIRQFGAWPRISDFALTSATSSWTTNQQSETEKNHTQEENKYNLENLFTAPNPK